MSDLAQRLDALTPERRRLLEKLRSKRRAEAPAARNTSALTAAATRPFELVSEEDRGRLPDGLEDAYPMTLLQLGMIYHMQVTADRPVPAYHNVSSWHLETPFEPGAFWQATRTVVARHPYLRTTFDLDHDSEPMQLVHREPLTPIAVVDLRSMTAPQRQREFQDFLERENRRLFDLSRPPLWRIHIHRSTDESFHFTFTEPHMISDGWSTTSTLSELFTLYYALIQGKPVAEPPQVPFTFRDAVAMERRVLASKEAERYWRRVIDGGTIFELPRRPKDAPEVGRVARERSGERKPFVVVPSEVVEELQRLAQIAGAPIKSVLLAAHMKFLRLMSGHDNVLSGLVCNGRPEQPGGDQVRGLFLNTLPFRLPKTAGSWIDLVRATFAAEAELLPFRHFPGPELQRRWSREPLFEVAFTYLHFHSFKKLASSGNFKYLPGQSDLSVTHYALFPIFHVSIAQPARLSLFLEHDDERLHAVEIQRYYAVYTRILRAMAEDPEASETSDWLSPSERHQILVERNESAPPVSRSAAARSAADGTFVERFAARVRATPNTDALVARDATLSYSELDRRANRLARYLEQLGVEPESPVALAMERGTDLVVSILAVLKAGGAYVYLDPAYPRERLALILEDTDAQTLILQHKPSSGLPRPIPRLISLEEDAPAIERQSAEAPSTRVAERQVAYLIYTSGSTGRPKGVAIEHRSAAALIDWAARAFSREELSAVLASTSFGFDLSIFELLVPLATGGTVVLAENILDLPSLPARDRVTFINTVPSAMAKLVETAELPASLRVAGLAGEPLMRRLVETVHAHRPEVRVMNLYGPSEDTTYSTEAEIVRGRGDEPTIGRPIINEQVYLVDSHFQPVHSGVAGEILIGGPGLARGYLNRPGQTGERFVPNPFGPSSGLAGSRLYRTGDLGRHRSDGKIEFLGRRDHQVKVHGFRIELGEIEVALQSHPGAHEAVVVVDGHGADSRLVAYVAGEAEPKQLRRHLGRKLPGFMVPRLYVTLDALPRNTNGKIDRRALPLVEDAAKAIGSRYIAPATEAEAKIAGVWQEVLGREQVGADDNFFDLGGSSLLILQLQRQLRGALGRELSVVSLLRYPTVRTLAASFEKTAAPTASETGRDRARERLTSGQRRRHRRRSLRES